LKNIWQLFRYQKDRRAKFKSTEDLLHRLYVCISGAADQLQSNYAGDFRAILKTVFIVNISCDDEEETAVSADTSAVAADNSALLSPETDASPSSPSPQTSVEAAASAAIAMETSMDRSGSSSHDVAMATSRSLPANLPEIDLATDALQQEISNRYCVEYLPNTSSSPEESAEGGPAAAAGIAAATGGGAVYAQNLDLQLRQGDDVDSSGGLNRGREDHEPRRNFFQDEPRLLDIASGDGLADDNLPIETQGEEGVFDHRITSPPR